MIKTINALLVVVSVVSSQYNLDVFENVDSRDVNGNKIILTYEQKKDFLDGLNKSKDLQITLDKSIKV